MIAFYRGSVHVPRELGVVGRCMVHRAPVVPEYEIMRLPDMSKLKSLLTHLIQQFIQKLGSLILG